MITHRQIRIPSFVLLLASMFVAAIGSVGCSTSTLHRETRQSTEQHIAGTPLKVTTANGAITVRESRQDLVRISATLKAETADRLAATAVTARRLDDGVLSIGVEWPAGGRRGREGCDFEIELPSTAGIELRTTNGAVQLAGMTGDAVLTTTNGSITVHGHGGPIVAQTSNGSVRINDPAAAVRVRTSNGSVRVEDAAAAVDVESSNGSVTLTLADSSPGPVRIRTSNSGVDLRVGSAFRGDLALRTSNGRINTSGMTHASVLSMSGNAARLRFTSADGSGGEASSVQTSNGGIRAASLTALGPGEASGSGG